MGDVRRERERGSGEGGMKIRSFFKVSVCATRARLTLLHHRRNHWDALEITSVERSAIEIHPQRASVLPSCRGPDDGSNP